MIDLLLSLLFLSTNVADCRGSCSLKKKIVKKKASICYISISAVLHQDVKSFFTYIYLTYIYLFTAGDGGGGSVSNEDEGGGEGEGEGDPVSGSNPPTRGSHLVEKSLKTLLPMADDTSGLNGKSLTIMNDFLEEGFTYAVAVTVDELGKIPLHSNVL